MDGISDKKLQWRTCRKSFSRMGWALVALLLVPSAVSLLLSVILDLVGSPLVRDDWFLMFTQAGVLYLVGFPLAAFLLRKLPVGEAERRPLRIWELLQMMCIVVGALFLGNIVTTIFTELISGLRGSPVTNPLEEVMDYPLGWLLLLTCVLAPLAEEILFRGLLLDRLRPYGDRFAVMASALAFAMMHGNLSQLIYAFTTGLILGCIALRTGRVRETVLCHAVTNFLGGGLSEVLMRIPGITEEVAVLTVAAVLLGVTALGIIFFLLRWRSFWPQQGEGIVSEGRAWGLFFSNVGMIVYTLVVLACIGIILFL